MLKDHSQVAPGLDVAEQHQGNEHQPGQHQAWQPAAVLPGLWKPGSASAQASPQGARRPPGLHLGPPRSELKPQILVTLSGTDWVGAW